MSKSKMSIEEIKSKISSTEKEIKEAEEKIKDLTHKKLKHQSPALQKDENEVLELAHQMNTLDIKLYKEKIERMGKDLKNKEETFLKLREENEKLKKEKNKNINKQESKEIKNRILNIKDLSKSIGILIRQDSTNETDTEVTNDEENSKDEKEEVIDKKIKEYEKIFDEFKEKGNQIDSIINEQKEKIKEYRNYLNEVQNYVADFRDRINMKINDKIVENDNLKLKDYNSLFETVSNLLFQLDNIVLINRDSYGQNIEYNLTNIQTIISDLNENKNEFKFKNKCTEIEQIADVIKNLFNDFEKAKNNFDSKNKNLEEELKKLKNIHDEVINQNKIQESQNKNNNKKENKKDLKKDVKKDDKESKEQKKKKLLGNSLLYNAKNQSKKLDIYQTINIFKKKDELNENLQEAKLLKKNYHEICYVYDDYDIHDIYYTLKAITLTNYSNFTLASFYFNGFNKIEIQEFDLDDLQSVKVHIKYKETTNSEIPNEQGIKPGKISRTDYYGLDSSLAGANAKYSLILKGNYIIVNFEDYFLIRNTNNSVDVEYMWGGTVPSKGKKTKITFSKREATWSFERVVKIHSNSFIKQTKIYVPIEFVGGNNEIINITPTSAEANDITLSDKNRQYIIKYNSTKYKKAELIIKGEFKNICKGDWSVDLSDKEIENLMPEEDIKDKEQLKKLAKKVISEFDLENLDNDFEYLDYMKIGMWVKNNIQYNYGYTGKKCSALKIYKMKAGVSYHYTRLANAFWLLL